MLKEKKEEIIQHLQEVLSESTISILADYRGLNNTQLTALRRKLGDAGLRCEVVKNSLVQIAAERTEIGSTRELFVGPVALISGKGDVTEPPKVLQSFISETKLEIAMKGGIMDNSLLSATEVIALAKLPSRESLIASVVGNIQAPIYGLVGCLAGPMRGLVTVLQGRIGQMEGA